MSEERLPMVDSDAGDGGSADARAPEGGAGVGAADGPGGPGSPPVELESSSVRLVGTLAVAGAIAGFAIVVAFQWANPRIEAWRAEVLSAAVTEVLAGADRYETAYLDDGEFTAAPTADTTGLDRVYVGYDEDGRPIGVAMVGEGAGFQDVIRLIFGYDPSDGHVIGMRVLESKETPGLGDKITKDSAFIGEFGDVGSPIVGVKAGRESGDAAEVTMITGATISSTAVIAIIDARLDDIRGAVDALWAETLAERGSAVGGAPTGALLGSAGGAGGAP